METPTIAHGAQSKIYNDPVSRDHPISEELRTFLVQNDLVYPPTEDELPYDDGEQMESDRHALQVTLLRETLRTHWADKTDVCIAGNLGIYYSLEQAEKQNFRAPDFFVTLGVPRRSRKSYILWFEGKAPDLVVELLSYSTAKADRGIKKQIYQDNMRVPEYILFDVATGIMEAFRLVPDPDEAHHVYYPVELGNEQSLESTTLPDLGLKAWEGEFENEWAVWLRWYDTSTGELIPTGVEMARTERKRTEEERKRTEKEFDRAEQEKARAERLAEKLRALGINPDEDS
jgi:Uma2 family endonuclease